MYVYIYIYICPVGGATGGLDPDAGGRLARRNPLLMSKLSYDGGLLCNCSVYEVHYYEGFLSIVRDCLRANCKSLTIERNPLPYYVLLRLSLLLLLSMLH